MTNGTQELGIESIIESTHELIESEINKKPDIYLLLDTNIAIDSCFCDSTYHTKDYSGVNTQELEMAIKAVEFGSELLDNPIIFIVRGVAKEITLFSKIVSERVQFYNKHQERKPRKKKGKYFHSSSLENKKGLYLELNDVCFGLKNKLDNAVYPIEDLTLYNEILSEVLKISEEKNLKREVMIGENIPRPFRRDHDKFNTDEELVALAIYLNSTRNRPVSILSQDSDISRIWKRIYLTSMVKSSDIRVLNPYERSMKKIRRVANY